MTDPAHPPPTPGTIGWLDLAAPNAESLREFYSAVVGWTTEPVEMEGYEDHVCLAADGTPVAGVCHSKGPNADLPTAWLAYVHVIDLEASMAEATQRGGEVLGGIRDMGSHGRVAVIRDPAGAVLSLFQAKS